MCCGCFRLLKRQKTFADAESKTLLDEDPCQTQEELAPA